MKVIQKFLKLAGKTDISKFLFEEGYYLDLLLLLLRVFCINSAKYKSLPLVYKETPLNTLKRAILFLV